MGVARWFSGRSLLLHLAVLVWVPGCGVAAWWQVTVALAGNALGWLYAVEWPVFAVLGVIGWWQLVHDDPATLAERRDQRRRRRGAASAVAAAPASSAGGAGPEPDREVTPALTPANVERIHRAESGDDDLAAYNAYLATLATTGSRKSWRHPTGEGEPSGEQS